MAITLDAQTVSSSTANQASYSFAHTCDASATVLIVLIGMQAGGTGVSGNVTYNAVAMTQVRHESISTFAHTYIYYLLSPSSGSNNVAFSTASNMQTTSVQAVSFFGTETDADVINAHNGDTDSSSPAALSYDVTSTVNDCWFLEVIEASGTDNTITQGAEAGRNDWSPDWEYEPGGTEGSMGGTYYDDEPLGAETFSWTFANATRALGSGVAIAPAVGGLTISPSAIASLEAFGAHVLSPGAVSILASAISTAEAFGAGLFQLYVTPSGIATAELFGSHTIVPGVVSILPSGLGSAEAFGTPFVQKEGVYIQPGGILSAEVFGTPLLALYVTPSGIGSAEAFGVATVAGGELTIAPVSIGSLEGFGLVVVLGGERGRSRWEMLLLVPWKEG